MPDTKINIAMAPAGVGLDYVPSPRYVFPRWDVAWGGLSEAGKAFARAATLLAADIGAVFLAVLGVVLASRLASRLGLEPDWDVVGPDKLQAAGPDLAFIGAAAILYMMCYGRYRARLPFWAETQQTCLVSMGALFGSCLEQFALRGDASRQLLIGCWILFPATAGLMRLAAKVALNKAGIWQINVLVVGDAPDAAYARTTLQTENLLGYRIVGVVDPSEILSPHQLRELLAGHAARHLILAIDFASGPGQRMVRAVVRERVPFSLIFRAHGVPVCGYEAVSFFSHDTVLLSHRNNLHHPVSKLIKALFDVSVALVLLALLAIPMLLVAAAIKRDGGPALFAQSRVGAGGRSFRCLKFRSMVMDAEHVLADVLAHDPRAAAEWAATHKLTNDPRVTGIGRLLRATSLDELPQLLNVLQLNMSLVGPRPIVHQEVARYGDDIIHYFETRPGLTGLWQVSGRSNTTYERRVELDRWYVHNWTIWHDLAILLKTVPAVLTRHGAR